MDLMAALRQLNPQFSGHYPAAAVCWITGDANLHLRLQTISGGGLESGIRWRGKAEDSGIPRLVRPLDVGEVDQFNAKMLQAGACSGRGKDAQFGFPRCPQPRADGAEIGIVVARVADELPSAVGNGTDDGIEKPFVERTG